MKYTAKNNLEAIWARSVIMMHLTSKSNQIWMNHLLCRPSFCSPGKPVMIVIECMENGSLDGFLRVSHLQRLRAASSYSNLCLCLLESAPAVCSRTHLVLRSRDPRLPPGQRRWLTGCVSLSEPRWSVHRHPAGGHAAGHRGRNEISLWYGIHPSRPGRSKYPCQQQSCM